MRINPEDFFDQIGATTEHQLNLKKNMAGYIDWDFDPSNYPNEWPRVILDGQGLSARTYPCLSSYQPMPGDRVILEALGSGHVIIGAVQDIPNRRLLPGMLVFKARSNQGQVIGTGAANAQEVYWDNIDLDLLSGWIGAVPSVAGDESGPATDYSARWTCTVAGWYQLSGAIGWANATSYPAPTPAANSYRSANWRVNGADDITIPTAGRNFPIGSQNHMTPARTTNVEFEVGDYVELRAIQQSPSSAQVQLATNTFAPTMEITYVGPGSLTEPFPTIE